MANSLRVLLISGSLRDHSPNTAVLRTAIEVAGDGVEATLYGGMAALPHFNPDDDREGERVPAAVAELRAEVAAAARGKIAEALAALVLTPPITTVADRAAPLACWSPSIRPPTFARLGRRRDILEDPAEVAGSHRGVDALGHRRRLQARGPASPRERVVQ